MFTQICSVREGTKDIQEFMLGGKYSIQCMQLLGIGMYLWAIHLKCYGLKKKNRYRIGLEEKFVFGVYIASDLRICSQDTSSTV